VSTHKPAALDHLLAMFGTHRRIEQLDEELRIAATHHSELDEHLRRQLADDAYDAPCSLITRTGAEQPITIHDTNAADSTALAAQVPRYLDADTDSGSAGSDPA
jgi:hypothetical protein